MTTDDEKLVRAMAYEFEMLDQSYRTFLFFLIKNKEEHSDLFKVHLYSSYGRVIQLLYEFMKACVARDMSKTKSEKNDVVKAYIVSHLQKWATGKPESSLPKSRFETFAEDLRVYRNKVPWHVLKERFADFPLDEFYSRNHVFVVWLISEAQHWWKSDYVQLANHPAIQKFSEVLTCGQRNVAKNDS